MPINEIEAIRISRELTPEHQSELLVWVQLAYVAENAVRKTIGIAPDPLEGGFTQKSQEYSCNNTLRRRKR